LKHLHHITAKDAFQEGDSKNFSGPFWHGSRENGDDVPPETEGAAEVENRRVPAGMRGCCGGTQRGEDGVDGRRKDEKSAVPNRSGRRGAVGSPEAAQRPFAPETGQRERPDQ